MTSDGIYNPCEILTDALVQKALNKEFGENAKLESFKVIDTRKQTIKSLSTIARLQVDYCLNDQRAQQFYIAKLYNNKVKSEEDEIDIVNQIAPLREPIVLERILESTNLLLKDTTELIIMAPRCLASCSDRGKEVMLTEDLQSQDFVKFDLTKEMNFEHAAFVVKRLAHFHASSLLHENPSKENTFVGDDYYRDLENKNHRQHSVLIMDQVQDSIEILNSIVKSDHVNSWWKNIRNFSASYMLRNSDFSEKFDVLINGDCWINNMMFRYNEDDKPIDFRLVDFKMARRSSPACDLVQFFYTSLTAELREKFKKELLSLYYQAFTKILTLASKSIPFTLEELEKEFTVRMPYGCISALMVLPKTAPTSDSSTDKNDPMKTRLLSMIVEMSKIGIFEHRRTIYNPYKILMEENVEACIQNNFGKLASLIAFEARKFTTVGENYASTVISITVHYDLRGITKEKSYVVKLNPLRDMSSLTEMVELFYRKEDLVLTTLIPGMNDELKQIDQPELKVPTTYYSCNKSSKEVLIMNNLKLEGFVLFGKLRGLDLTHCLLVMEELGRFHASSRLYEDTLKRPIREKFSKHFNKDWLSLEDPGLKLFNQLLEGSFNTCIGLLESMTGYEKEISWIRKIKAEAALIYFPAYEPNNKQFNVLNHGDCWNNNFMFKYDPDGNPIDIRLVDFQVSRVLSVACDLNYLMFTSVPGELKQKHMNTFLVHYYIAFSQVLLLANKTVPFTFEELKEEVKRYLLYGCIVGINVLPHLMSESEEKFSFDELDEENLEDFLENQKNKVKMSSSKKKDFAKNLLFMMDEMKVNGIIT